MKRKTIQLAGKTLVVSLPAKWCKTHGVEKGAELEVTTDGPLLTVHSGSAGNASTVEFDAKGLSERALRWALSGLHKKGYEEMTLHFDHDQLGTIQDVVKQLMLGFTIIDQRAHSCVIRSIAKEDPGEFDVALRRAFLVTLSMGDNIVEALRDDALQDLPRIAELEQTNNQLTNFCERLINTEKVRSHHASFRYVIAWNLEKIADEYKYICKASGEVSKEQVNLLEEVNRIVRAYYELYYKFDVKMLSDTAQRAKVLEQIAFKSVEKSNARFNHHVLKILSHAMDFSGSMLAIHK